jgi:dihydrofolate reductase
LPASDPLGPTGITASVFVGTSVDGFIARSNHELDFLPEVPEDHGYDEFMATVDALVMGRNTFDKVLSFGGWHYGKKPVFVLTSRPAPRPLPAGAMVEFLSGGPTDIVAGLAERGFRHLYIDGGATIQQFLRERLIQRLIITHVPVLIGDGIRLFGALSEDVRLRHIRTRSFPSGLVQSEYAIDRPG